MAKKSDTDQSPARRAPQQARAHHKIGLILEAAMRLLESGGMEALTTNAVAATAGISIGTLYQYFRDKQAILDALADRELGDMKEKVMEAVQAPAAVPGGRMRQIMRAALSVYGGRNRVHRTLMSHALTRSDGSRLNPLYAGLTGLFTATGVTLPDGSLRKLTQAEAFVLTHAVGGVLRALAASETPPDKRKIEDALVQLVAGFTAQLAAKP